MAEASTSAPTSDAWRLSWDRHVPQYELLRDRLKVPAALQVLRVNQVDAARLDVEMSAMLREQLLKMFSLVRPGALSRYEAELNAILEFLVWRFSIWKDKPTPGNALMNLRYRNERAGGPQLLGRTGLEGPGLSMRQKVLFLVLTVGGRYGWTRVQGMDVFRRLGEMDANSWERRAWRLLQGGGSIFKLASLLNLLLFLRTGRYQSVVERLLGTRLVYARPTMSRAVSFEFMNRQLVWQEFSELLLLILPLLNLSSVKKVLAYPFAATSSSTLELPLDTCPICQANPIAVPFSASPCSHIFCYYCIRTRAAADPFFKCPRCDVEVVSIEMYRPMKVDVSRE